ncbi:MAG: protein kinase domain-containing protein [Fimbriiglobus sp.]
MQDKFTIAQFVDMVRKSGLLEEPKLAPSLTKAESLEPPLATSKEMADFLVEEGHLTYFQAEQILQGKFRRFFLGKYKVLERIGSGGMGQVYLCEHKLMRRRVAIKVLPAAKSNDPASLDRFHREARAVAAVDHPNLVRAYDIDQDQNLHFLVLEFVDGANFNDLVRKTGPLPVTRACHYIYSACIGLQHAHEMGLVHRDIKPGNILVDRSGVVKILDMGLARFFNDEEDALTRKYDENILGTADYLAPEQALDSHTVDIRADLYSLGGTFYYLLTGKAPFPEGSVAQKLLWHQQRQPAALTTYRNDLPPEIVAIVGKMLAKNPDDRFQTPGEVMKALYQWVQQPVGPPSAEEMPTLSRAARGTGGPITSRVVAGAQTLGAPSGVLVSPSHSGSSFGGSSIGIPKIPGSTATNAMSITPQAAPSPVPDANPFADFGDPDPMGPKSIVKVKAPPSVKVPKPTSSEPKPSKKWLFLILGLGLLVGLPALGGVGYFLLKSSPTTVTNTDTGKIWYVTKSGTSPNPNRTLSTLAGAIDQAKADETILLLDERIEDPPIRYSDAGKNAKRGLTIQPGPGRDRVIWAPKFTGAKAGPALDITYVENLSIRGLTIELNATGESGVSVGFNTPGLTLENITVNNPRVSGFRFQQTNADSARPVKITKCRVSSELRFESAMYFSGNNRFVMITDCRIEGPCAAGIKIDGPISESEIKNNRIWNCDSGLWFTGKVTTDQPFQLLIANNTFHSMSSAAVSPDLMLTGAKHRLEFTKNYFGRVAEIVGGPRDKQPGMAFRDNATDKSSKEGKYKTTSNNLGDDPMSPADPKNDETFLRSTKITAYGYQRP